MDIKNELEHELENGDLKNNIAEYEFKVGITSEQGCEEFLQQELFQRFKKESEIRENWVLFNADIDKIAEIMYLSQTAKRIVIVISEGEFEGVEALDEKISESLKSSNIIDFLHKKTSRIVCDRTGTHDFNSVDAEQIVMASVKESLLKRQKEVTISLNSPELILYLRIVDNKYLFGLDCAGRELSKRQHLVFNNANSIKGTIGFSALLYAGYKPGMLLLDPFSLSGNIMLEAALLKSNISPNYYTKKFSLLLIPEFRDRVEGIIKKADTKIKSAPSKPDILSSDSLFNNVSAQKKNAKIAGADKFISFSRTDIYNLDIKSFDDRLDMVCSRVVEPSNHFSENQARNICSTMFRTLKYVLKKDAVLVFIVRNPEVLEQEGEKEGYIEEGLKQVWQGQQGFFLVKFKPGEIKEY